MERLRYPTFVSAAGVKVEQDKELGALLVAGTTYYADLGPGVANSRLIGTHLHWDATFGGTGTWDASGLPHVTPHATSGWVTQTAPSSVTMTTGAVGDDLQQWIDVEAYRVRLVVPCTTGGRLLFTVTTKED